jgi:osmotically-inducible protein OsmY
MRKISILFILFLASSCVEIALLTSVKTASIVTREKSISNSSEDLMIETRLIKDFTFNGFKSPVNMVDITVNEGRVLLTGIVKNEKKARKAVDIAWKIKNVREVIDEIQIVKNFRIFRTSNQYLKDSAITSNIQSKLIFAKNIASANYQIITVNSVVYILGTAQSQSAIYKVSNIAAKAKGVNRVVSHVILKNDKRRRA